MSTLTTNYGLIKPQLSDPANIEATNANWDKIDNELKSINDNLPEEVAKLQTKITCGTGTPSGGVNGDVYIQLIEE
jgi:hypothetical protein